MKLENQAKKAINEQKKASIKRVTTDYASAKEAIKSSWYYRAVLTKKELASVEGMTDAKVKKLLKDAIVRNYSKTLEKTLKNIAKYKAIDTKECRWGACSIDWVKNRTWGNCPRGDYRNGHNYQEFRSVTGCGYDKLSTLTAQMFNADAYLTAFVMDYIERHSINDKNIRERLGYGIHLVHGIPVWDGGVGVSCHVAILKKLGFKVVYTETKRSDYIEFTRK